MMMTIISDIKFKKKKQQKIVRNYFQMNPV